MFDALFFIFIGLVAGWFSANTNFAKRITEFLVLQYNKYK